MKRVERNYIWVILLVVSAAVFLLSASKLVSGYAISAAEESEFKTLAQHVGLAQQDTSSSCENSAILQQYTELLKENSEFGGWIRIPGTKIDYPVMFTPDEPEKYLNRSFLGEYSYKGVPFIGAGCSIAPRSQNIIIYGHHMKDGSMFATLERYKNEEFWHEHPTIYFSTLYEKGEYEVFAAIETDIYAAQDLRCYSYINKSDQTDFKKYISAIQQASLYNTGIDVKYSDELLTLSTCSYHTNDGRFVVVAKKIIN